MNIREMIKGNGFKKKLVMVSAAGLLVVGMAGVGSYSYFTDRGVMVNDLSTGGLDVIESETLWDNDTDGKNMHPGYTVKKNPTITNITGILDNNAYIRAQITIKDGEGDRITSKKRNDLIYETIRWDATNTMLEGKKYSLDKVHSYPNVNPEFYYVAEESDPDKGLYVYYLSRVLRSTESTEHTTDGENSITLFNTIVLPYEWSQDELDVMGDYQVEVDFRAIQEKAFDSVEDAMQTLRDIEVHKDYSRPLGDDSNKISDK